jgi:hypothetical protein
MAIFLSSVSLPNLNTESIALPLTQYQNVLNCIYMCVCVCVYIYIYICHRCLEEEMMQLMGYNVCEQT